MGRHMVKCPNRPSMFDDNLFIFLGGSIEMGKAEDWQKAIWVQTKEEYPITYLNPRRDFWDGSWDTEKPTGELKRQIDWEYEFQDLADIRIYYFQPNTKSPITLMELGLFADRGKDNWVVCPPGYWRRGNVLSIAERYGMTVMDDLVTGVGRKIFLLGEELCQKDQK